MNLLTRWLVIACLVFTPLILRAADANPPFTLDSIKSLQAAGLSEKEMNDIILKRGVGFDTNEKTVADLRAAGFSDLTIKVILDQAIKRKLTPPPYTLENLTAMKTAGLSDDEITALVEKRGVNFEFNNQSLETLTKAGFGPTLIKLIEDKCMKLTAGGTATSPATPAPTPVGVGSPILPPETPAPVKPLVPPAPISPVQNDPNVLDPNKSPAPPSTPVSIPKKDSPAGPPAEAPGPTLRPSATDDDEPLPDPAPKNAAGKTPATEVKPATSTTPAPKNPFPKKPNPADDLLKTTECPAGMFFGPRAPEATQNRFADNFKQIITQSTLKLSEAQSKHITLIASDANIKTYLPGIKALEAKLESKFNGIIKTGPDKRSTVIVLVDSQADYKTWVTTMMVALGMDKPRADQGPSQLEFALSARSISSQFFAVHDLSVQNTQTERETSIAYKVGTLYMGELTEAGAPDCFVSGFGNYCEALMFNNPMTRAYSYEERTIAGDPKMSWVSQMKDAVGKRTATASSEVLSFSTVTMKAINYIEAWSFITYLTQKPADFENLVTALRDRNPAAKSIEAFYNLKGAQLNYQWQLWAGQQN